jgi:site-specific recombinase XerD
MTEQMTPLRRRMIDDMALRNMSPLTQQAYVRAVKNFSLFFRRSPDKLTFEDVRTYQLHLISRGLQAQAINQIACALRFLYAVTLGKPEAKTQIPLARPLHASCCDQQQPPYLARRRSGHLPLEGLSAGRQGQGDDACRRRVQTKKCAAACMPP